MIFVTPSPCFVGPCPGTWDIPEVMTGWDGGVNVVTVELDCFSGSLNNVCKGLLCFFLCKHTHFARSLLFKKDLISSVAESDLFFAQE